MLTATEIQFRWLDGDDLDLLEPLIRSRRWTPLNKALCRAFAGFDRDGNVVGFCAFQCIPHVGPWLVDPEYRGTGVAEEMVKGMVEFLTAVNPPSVYVVADSPISARLAEEHGMELVTSPVYRKVG